MLENLIEKMSGSEKRHFVLKNESFKRNPEHVRLFKFLSRGKVNKDGSLEDFEKGFSGNLASLKKRYLKESLLDSLRSYNRKNTPGIIIMNHLQDAEIFYRKLLFKECINSLKKAKRLAVTHERFGLHLEILNWERRLIGSTLEIYDISEKMIDKEEETIHEKNNNELWARKLQASVFEYKKKHGFLDKTQAKIFSKNFKESELGIDNKMKSKRASFYYLWMLTLYYSMTSEHEKSHEASKKISKDYVDVVDPEDLFYGMLEHVTSCMYTHKYEEALKQLSSLKKLKDEPYFKGIVAIDERFYYYNTNYSLISHTAIGDEKKASKLIKSIDQDIRHKEGLISEQMSKVVQSSLSQVYFSLGNFQKAKEFCIMTLSTPKGKIRADIKENVKLLYLIVLLELEQYDLLESEIISSKNFYSSKSNHYKYQIKIIDTIKMNFNKEEVASEVIHQIQLKFETLGPNEYYDDLIFLMWGKSVLNKTSTMIEFKNWMKQREA